jgi:hypothetical protein
MWSRIYLTPLLQAEEDRDQARRYFADQAREKELFGTQTSAYNSDRYVSRQLATLERTDSEATASTALEPCCIQCARRIKADMFCLVADSSGQHSCTRPQK